MMQRAERAGISGRGFLARLRRDTRGNTMAIMAAALLPLCGFAGSAMDMARLYVVKVRLQQACDAGALAGRKFLPAGTLANVNIVNASVASNNTTPASDGRTLAADGTQALTYFNANLESSWGGSGWFNASTDKFTANTIADSNTNTQVAGTATAQVPMTLMQIFGFTAQAVNVACQASFSTPDTDVMFVLDTTGSMGCAVTRSDPDCTSYAGSSGTSTKNSDGSMSYWVKEETSGGANISRIDSLRKAVIAFYNVVHDTKDSSTNVRYGFVPYTSTVNVGNLLYNLNPSYLVSKWPYQSRTPTGDYYISTISSQVVTAADQNACNGYYLRVPATRTNAAGDANAGYPNGGTAIANDPVWTPANGNGKGTGNGNSPAKCTVNTDKVGPIWTYQSGVQYDVSNYLRGNTIADPGRVDGSTTVWNGCIEERDTTPGVTSFNQSSLPGDLDPDLVPTSDTTRWRPMWADVVYRRNIYAQNNGLYYLSQSWGASTMNDNDPRLVNNYNDSAIAQGGGSSCPAQALPLFTPDKDTGINVISNYVAGLKALGGTYHDTGMIWGTRLLSPTGLWKNNNAWPAGRAAPKRVVVFVTDGVMSPSSGLYGAYSVEFPDRRVTGSYFGTGDPSAGKNSNGDCVDASANCTAYTNFHNQRFLAECAKAKSNPLNFDVWVVEVASASSPELSQCASRPTQVLVGKTPDELTTAFKQIAAQVAMLRVSN